MEIVSRYSDVFLAVTVVLAVVLMILPLPTWLIDVLLAVNLTIGITVLLVVLSISTAIKLTAFPSLLLLATLFRLGLNVSTTRLILLTGDAGEMVRAFGRCVVSGNLVVGAIIFLILTLINFIVISKGSERVAEVSARFSLDAMPGKQLAIDADLRGGAIDMDEARRRRRQLSRESQLFGAMDGAMKFVKGDAIAGMIITCINMAGGVCVGVFMLGMPASTALSHFGLLTIGDGLLSQIPSLILSAAAGFMVTRVEPENPGDDMGKDISQQLLGYPKSIALVAGFLCLLGLVPGLPLLPFWTIAAGAAGLAFRMTKHSRHRTPSETKHMARMAAADRSEVPSFSIPAPITLIMSTPLTQRLQIDQPENAVMTRMIPALRDDLYREFGVQIPSIRFRGFHADLQEDEFNIQIYETPVLSGRIPSGSAFVLNADDQLPAIAGRGKQTDACFPCAGTLVPRNSAERLEQAGYEVYSDETLLTFILKSTLKRHLKDFLGLQEVKWMCDELEKYYPDTVGEVLPRVISYQRLGDVLGRLVQEEISIRDLKLILESIAAYAESEPDNVALTDRIRSHLSRQIFHQYSQNGCLNVILLDPRIEDTFRESIQVFGQERSVVLEPMDVDRIIRSFASVLNVRTHHAPVFLTVDPAIRYVLWRFLSQNHPGVHVMAAQELPPGAHFNAMGHVMLCA
ncbi:type III secretion system export apparatus subunit SctV [bacterium]|nr:type III secretion system export apparatus subunit SctV [candidate division CSSED10-310 bacterium]